jgi:hypothetical protein
MLLPSGILPKVAVQPVASEGIHIILDKYVEIDRQADIDIDT